MLRRFLKEFFVLKEITATMYIVDHPSNSPYPGDDDSTFDCSRQMSPVKDSGPGGRTGRHRTNTVCLLQKGNRLTTVE